MNQIPQREPGPITPRVRQAAARLRTNIDAASGTPTPPHIRAWAEGDDVIVPAPYRIRAARLGFEFARLQVHRLLEAEGAVRHNGRANLKRAGAYEAEWGALLDAPLGELIAAMLGIDEQAAELRRHSPFTILSQPERELAIVRAGRTP